MKHNWIIIGLGNIGFRYDMDANALSTGFQKYPQSHFSSIQCQGMSVLYGVDTDPIKRNDFSQRTSKVAFATIDQALKNKDFDSIVISVPTVHALNCLREVAHSSSSRIINLILEKPLGENEFQSAEILKIGGTIAENIYINYPREFSLGRNELSKRVRGTIKYAYVNLYTDLRNNGSHFIRLILGLFFPNGNFDTLKMKIISHDSFLFENESGSKFQLNLNSFKGSVLFDAQIDYESGDCLKILDNKFLVISKAPDFGNSKSEKIVVSGDLLGGMHEMYRKISLSSLNYDLSYNAQAAVTVNKVIDFVASANGHL